MSTGPRPAQGTWPDYSLRTVAEVDAAIKEARIAKKVQRELARYRAEYRKDAA